jgi:hypothetical protein
VRALYLEMRETIEGPNIVIVRSLAALEKKHPIIVSVFGDLF